MTIDINELRDRAATFGSDYLTDEEWVEVIDRLEAAEKEFESWKGLAAQFCREVVTLRDKIEAMERQEPSHWGCIVLQSDGKWKEEVSREAPPEGYFSVRDAFPLYLAPGAQPALIEKPNEELK